MGAVLAESQAPWAGIITCADSRGLPNWIFDVNPGQLFVVRSAGNTAFDDAVASMEYAVANLSVSLIMVLGHSCWGAVPRGLQDLEQGVEHNARSAAESLASKSQVLARAVQAGTLKIYGAVYDIVSSRVRLV